MESNSLKRTEKILWKVFAACGIIAVAGILILIKSSKEDGTEVPSDVVAAEAPEYGEQEGLDDATYWLPSGYIPYGKIPEIIFEDREGTRHSVREWEGKTTILVFWASWCNDCKEQMAYMKEYMQSAKEYGDITFVFVNKMDGVEETKESADAYFRQLDLGTDTYYGSQEEAFEILGIRNIPTVIFLDAEGKAMACSPRQITDKGVFEGLLQNAVLGSGAVTAGFVRNHMTDKEGGIHSAYGKGADADSRQEVLSESQGLMLLYAAAVGDQELFDSTLSYIKKYMCKDGLAAWRVENGTPSEVNALLDDLRIYKGLRQAEELWGGYDGDIAYYEKALLDYGMKKSGFVDFYDCGSRKYATRFTLCYADLEAMKLLAQKDERFEKAYRNAQDILEKGQISGEFPLYYSWYNYRSKRYEEDDLNTAEAMMALLHLARQDKLPDNSVKWLKSKIDGDGVKARYTVNGEVVMGYDYESTAVYAIIVMIAEETGDDELRGKAFKKMERMRIADTSLEYNGAFGMKDGSGITSFDQLMPMIAYAYAADQNNAVSGR